MLELQLEMMESKFADNDGAASAHQLEAYQRASNSLRRLLESLGLNNGRKYAAPRDVTGEVVARIRAGTV
jgi:predicted polyphosphate/ATP-dependent NAD kinase